METKNQSAMKIRVLGSNSRGNCYIISNLTEAIIIECGIHFSEVKEALDYNISKVAGVCISHGHL